MCSLVFIANQGVVMYQARYWRPIEWGIYWIVIQVIVGLVGIVGAAKRSPGFLIVFVVLTVMFACVNIAHTNEMRSEILRSCRISQVAFKNCNPTHFVSAKPLQACIFTDNCTADQIDATQCEAPGSLHCADVQKTALVFFINALVNFLTYAEPCFWGLMVLIRSEKTNDTCPDDPKDEGEFPYPNFPQLFGDDSESQQLVDKTPQ